MLSTSVAVVFSAVLIWTYGPPDTPDRYTLYPIIPVDVLGAQVSVTLCGVGVVPTPVIAPVAGEFVAVLVRLRLPFIVPDDCGLKTRVRVLLVPAGIVSGKDNPLTEKAGLFMPAAETVTAPPVAASATDCFWLLPTTTLPKLTLEGVMLNCPGREELPLRGIDTLELEAFDATAMLPL